MIKMQMLPVLFVAVVGALSLGWTCIEPQRPYELDWAGRVTDEHPAILPLASADGWKVEATDAVASVSTTTNRLLFGEGVVRLVYRGTGENPHVRLVPPTGVKVRGDFDAIAIWCYGNNYWWQIDPKTPQTKLWAEFADRDGAVFELPIGVVMHRGWFKIIHILTPGEKRRIAGGCTLRAIVQTGGTNAEDRTIDLNSLTVFDETKAPLSFGARPRRGYRLFDDQPQGINVGAGTLPFPNTPKTVIPPNASRGRLEVKLPSKASNWDDFALRWGDGPWTRVAIAGGLWFDDGTGELVRPDREEVRRVEGTDELSFEGKVCRGDRELGEVTVNFRVEGKSVVADLRVKGGRLAETRFGRTDAAQPQRIPLPFYTGHFVELKPIDPCDRPCVLAFGADAAKTFLTETVDWTTSNASEPFFLPGEKTAAMGGARYTPKTDGVRNEAYERFVWTLSDKLEETLPNIPNNPSPWRHVTGSRPWCCFSFYDRDRPEVEKRLRHIRRLGIKNLIVTDHEVMWRDGEESFTFRTNAAPAKGGDKAQERYTRVLIDELGFNYGPYNNYTDFAPVNENWHVDRVARTPDNQLRTAWVRCYNPKVVYGVNMCEKLIPVIQRKFGFNAAYCDVQTIWPPWGRVDFDARTPGAGTFAQAFYAFGEILLLQRQTWRGPVSSEGGCQYLYAGLVDQNYAQDQGYDFTRNPWLVDFELRRVHPLCTNFGMTQVGSQYAGLSDRGWTDGNLCATMAFGHPAHYSDGGYSSFATYFMLQAIAARYTLATAEDIRYVDAGGRAKPVSAAVADGSVRRSQILTRYSDGTVTAANGSTNLTMRATLGDRAFSLPPAGFAALSGDGQVSVVSSLVNGGRRADLSVSPEYAYADGRGTAFASPLGTCEGQFVRHFGAGAEEEVVPGFGAKEVILPFAAARVEALDEERKPVAGDAGFSIEQNSTVLRVRPEIVSWRVVRPPDVKKPNAVHVLKELL